MAKKGSNIREIARIAGVSVASVSRALNPLETDKVSPILRQKILAICDELHYQPNMHTVRMFAKRANNVAFIYPQATDLSDLMSCGGMDPNLAACINGAESYLSSQGIYLTLTSTTKAYLEKREYLKIFRSKMVDGVIIWGWVEGEQYLDELQQEGVPLVMLQTAPANGTVNSVVADDITGMTMIADHVVEAGHRNIAVAVPAQRSSAGKKRLQSVSRRLKEHGITAYFTDCEGFGPDFGYQAAREIFEQAPATTCIIAPNDTAITGIYQAAKEHGRSIPHDLSVTGADGVQLITPLPVTSYCSPSFDIGYEGANLLYQLIEHPRRQTVQKQLPVTFIPGETVRCLQ